MIVKVGKFENGPDLVVCICFLFISVLEAYLPITHFPEKFSNEKNMLFCGGESVSYTIKCAFFSLRLFHFILN